MNRAEARFLRGAAAGLVLLGALAAGTAFIPYSRHETREGRVVDEEGRPVAGAFVAMTVEPPLWHDLDVSDPALRPTARTDENGRFTLHAVWSEGAGTYLAYVLGVMPYRARVEACRNDMIPEEYDLEALDPEDLVLMLSARGDAKPYPWDSPLLFMSEGADECGLIDANDLEAEPEPEPEAS